MIAVVVGVVVGDIAVSVAAAAAHGHVIWMPALPSILARTQARSHGSTYIDPRVPPPSSLRPARVLRVRGGPLGVVLRPPWVIFGPPWRSLGQSSDATMPPWRRPGGARAVPRRPGAILESPCGRPGRRSPKGISQCIKSTRRARGEVLAAAWDASGASWSSRGSGVAPPGHSFGGPPAFPRLSRVHYPRGVPPRLDEARPDAPRLASGDYRNAEGGAPWTAGLGG